MKRFLVALFCLMATPALAHNGGSSNSADAGVLRMTAYAELSDPLDADTFITTDRIDFTSDTEHKIKLKNLSGSGQMFSYSYSFQLKAGLAGGMMAVLLMSGTAPGQTITWAATANQEITAQTSALDTHWNGTGVGNYTARAYTKVTSGTTNAEVNHDHAFAVNFF